VSAFALIMTRSLFLVFALGCATLASAQPWAPFHAKPLEAQLRLVSTATAKSWAVLGLQTTFRITDRMAEWDGMPARYIDFNTTGLALELPFEALESWVQTGKPTGRYTYELAHKFDDKVRFGFTAVRRASFLSNLDTPAWNSYLGSLGSNPNPRLVTNDDSLTNNLMLRVLGGRTRVLEYRFSGEEPDDPVLSVSQIFVDLGSGPIVIFTLEANAAELPKVGPEFEDLVGSFGFLENR